jgi:protein SCO1/2
VEAAEDLSQLTTHDGRRLRFYDDLLRGKAVVIQFLYTECAGICPGTIAGLVRVQEMLGDRVGRDVFFYSITLDPEHDTVEVLRRYVEENGIRPGWLLVTGKADEIDVLRRKFGLYDRDPAIDADRSQHAGLLVYGNEPTGHWGFVPALATRRDRSPAR